jgi:hypothetical protein
MCMIHNPNGTKEKKMEKEFSSHFYPHPSHSLEGPTMVVTFLDLFFFCKARHQT